MSDQSIQNRIDQHLSARLHDRLMRNYASALIQLAKIDPAGQELVITLGTGFERNNREALVSWVRNHPHQFYHYESQAHQMLQYLEYQLNCLEREPNLFLFR